MVAFPNAKINIGLDVTSRRVDGYHTIETIFYPVSIVDVLEVVEADILSFTSTGLEIPGTHDSNLCLKAYHLVRNDYDIPPVHIHLHKHIPIGAGLGGGSSNAAFFIKLLNDKFSLELTVDQMEGYCRKLGADCAFFIRNEPVYAFELGDRFKEIDLNLNSYQIILVKPPVHVSTGEAYRGVKPSKPKVSLTKSIAAPIEDWKRVIKNDFEESIFRNHPTIRGVKAELYESGALFSSMSGSGSSVFGIFADKELRLPELEKENQVFYNL